VEGGRVGENCGLILLFFEEGWFGFEGLVVALSELEILGGWLIGTLGEGYSHTL